MWERSLLTWTWHPNRVGAMEMANLGFLLCQFAMSILGLFAIGYSVQSWLLFNAEFQLWRAMSPV